MPATAGSTARQVSRQATDGLFDDFAYIFMHNADFQKSRIHFPLPNKEDGINRPIASKDWKFNRLYSHLDAYTLLLDGEKSDVAEKDTMVQQVVVEWVYLKKKRVKQYIFKKTDGRWMLTAIDSHPLANNVNSDFYHFYRRFVTEADYQKQHIANPFAFATYDPYSEQRIDGVLDRDQWSDFRPELPTDVLTNINYGQSYADSSCRVFMICSASGGMGCSITFKRQGKMGWMLTKLEN